MIQPLVTFRRPTREAGRLARAAVVAALAALPLAACGDLLSVPDPDVATPGTLDNEAGLPAVIAAAIGDFQVAYGGYQGSGGGSGEGQILV
ncbi:MAG TPA: hypothetical protein VFX29_07415, partial [Longimicrobiaceae bacterium]|nr:hypothetical protein [Longimicrobiaceae bacterium]